jgi:S-DNA-T family DNA segregation ATPase FtsK/SpoIIIE
MLFAPGGKPNPTRVQGAFVSETETAAVVEFVKNQVKGAVMYDEQAMEDMKRAAQKCNKDKGGADDDDMDSDDGAGFLHDRKFLTAVELAIRNGSVATSFLQRKLRIGYGKAAQYIDTMEDLGVVGEKNGAKPRDILISMSEWNEKLSRLTSIDD